LADLFVQGMFGLGDNIYQRAVIRELVGEHDVWLETPWPQLYGDLPVRCVKPATKLRTQAKNAERWASWANPRRGVMPRRVSYAGAEGTILEALCAAFGVKASTIAFDLPAFARDLERPPYIVIRPATERKEWPAASRNPRPEYLAMASERLRRDFRIISVADLVPGVEWPVLPLPYADETYHAGEFHVDQLMTLVAGAAGVVGGVGWLVPAAVAYRVPMLCIFGGWGKHNGPGRIFDRRMDTSRIEQVMPSRFCMCGQRDHSCDKRIDAFDERLERWAVALTGSKSVAMAA
jgi:hypothetical protein